MTDATNLIRIVQETQPDEIYNLAAQSHVQVSFETPEYTANADAHRHAAPARGDPHPRAARRRRASTRPRPPSSTARCRRCRRRETTPFYPRSPYAAAKLYAYWITVNYREAYGMHASNGILFNHESPLRGETFVTRKITRAVAAIELGLQEKLYLGNLDAKRDWGHARDYVAGMWLMLQQDEARRLRAGDRRDAHRCASSSSWPSPMSARASNGAARASTRRAIDADDRQGAGRDRSALFPPDRGRPAARRSHQGARRKLGWKHKTTFARPGAARWCDADLEGACEHRRP